MLHEDKHVRYIDRTTNMSGNNFRKKKSRSKDTQKTREEKR